MSDPHTWTKDETPVHLINPLTSDISITLFDDDNKSSEKVIPSLEILTYPKWEAEIIKKHILDAVVNDRGLGFVTPENLTELLKEIEV